jgi:hypothetical protein
MTHHDLLTAFPITLSCHKPSHSRCAINTAACCCSCCRAVDMSDRSEGEERQGQEAQNVDELEQEDEEDEDEEQPARAGDGRSFREVLESESLTINDIVELDEDDDDDGDFQPDEAEEEEEDEEQEEEEDDEETEEALAEEAADDELERSVEREEAEEEELADAEGDADGEDDGELPGGAELLRDAALSSFVSRVMQADGPTVKTVLLKADGTQQELVRQLRLQLAALTSAASHLTSGSVLLLCSPPQTLDMTPRLNAAGAVLGCKARLAQGGCDLRPASGAAAVSLMRIACCCLAVSPSAL